MHQASLTCLGSYFTLKAACINRPFEMLLEPEVNANALAWAGDGNKARTSTNIDVG
ncbi:MAG: hypothetical protein R2722_14835 [Tessaracoccus sp.]